jgi:hypothetical protein
MRLSSFSLGFETGSTRDAMSSSGSSRLAGLTILALLFAGPVRPDDGERWRSYPDVGLLEHVVVRVHWFDSSKELRSAAKTSGQNINEIGLSGFSVLKRNSKTGEYSCDVYVVKMTGAQLDGDRTTTFGHEVLHCLGLKHE